MSVELQDTKFVNLFASSQASTGTIAGTVDCLGYDYASIFMHGDTTSTNPSVLRLLEGTNSSPATEVSGAVGDTDFTIPDPNTNDGMQFVFHVDLRNRERWLALETQPAGATQLVTGMALLSRAKNAPVTDAERVGPGTVGVVIL